MQRDDENKVAQPLKASEHDPRLPVETPARGKLMKITFMELRAQRKKKLHEELLAQYELEKQREKCLSKVPEVEVS